MYKLLIIAGLVFLMLACKNADSAKNTKTKQLTFIGSVMITGNEPHTFPIIVTTENKKYNIVKSAQKKIAVLSGSGNYLFTGYITIEPSGEKNIYVHDGIFDPVKWEKQPD